MPRPGDNRAAHFQVRLRDLVWEMLYAPVADVIGFVANRFNRFQFLTIRRYLSLVFLLLVLLLLALTIWP